MRSDLSYRVCQYFVRGSACAILLVVAPIASAIELASYSFHGTNPQASSDSDLNTIATDVASSIEFAYSATGNPSSSLFLNGSWKAVGEIGPTISTPDFLVFTISPSAGRQMNLQSLQFDLNRNGPTATGSYALYVDEGRAAAGNNFATKIGGGSLASVGSWQSAQIDLTNVAFLQNATEPTTFRLYLYGETASVAANFDNLVVHGTTELASATSDPAAPGGHISQFAIARPTVPGAPSYEDVVISSRWIHPRNSSDPDDTYVAIAEFQPTAIVWANPHTASGKGNANYIKSMESSGLDFGGALYGGMTDTPLVATRTVGRDRYLNGAASEEGDITSQAFREVTLSHMKFMVDNGADSFQMDDPSLTYGQALSNGGGYGSSAMTKFATYLSSNGFAGQHGLPANLSNFDYRNWVLGRPNQQDTTPVRTAFLTFHQQQLQEYYSYIKSEINSYAGHYVPFSVNNTSVNVQSGAPYNYAEVDFWIGETSEQYGQVITSGPKGIYNKVKGAEAVGRRQVFSPPNDSLSFGTITSDAQYLRVSRQIFAAAYASGSVSLIPWDVWRREDPRYFATFNEFGDLTQLVGQNQHLFADHEQVYAVGSGLAPQFAPGLSTEPIRLIGTSDKFLATVRAAPDRADAVVHLVDWNTTTSAFSIDLNNALFGWPADMPITANLLLPHVDGTITQEMTGVLSLATGYTRFNIPAINPYALLAVQAFANLPGDFDGNGTVDIADYVTWRMGSANPMPSMDEDDYEDWRANFGDSLGNGSGTSDAVPEPATWMLTTLALVAYATRRPKRSCAGGSNSARAGC